MAPGGADLASESLQSAADLIRELPGGDDLAAVYGAIAADGQVARERRETAALFSIAEKQLEGGDIEEALQLALEALDAARGREDRAAEADVLRLVIQCFRYKEKQAFAMQMAEEELALFKSRGDAVGQAKILLSMAEVSMDRSGQEHRKKALEWAEDARLIFREEKEKNLEATALLALVKVYITSKHGNAKDFVKLGEKAAKEALAIFEDAQDRRGMAKALHCLGAARAHGRQTEGALQASSAALALSRELGDRRMEAFELQSAATWRLIGDDPWGALPDAEAALAAFRSLHCGAAWEASALGTLARAHCARQEATAALHVLKDGLQRLRLAGDPAAEARALDALVHAYVANDDVKGAIRAAERARSAFRSTGNKQMESLMLRTVSKLQVTAWDTGVALETAEAAVTLGKELQSAKEKGDALLQLANARLAGGLYEEALQAAEEARGVFEQEGDRASEGVALLTEGLIYSHQGRPDQAGSATMQAYVLFREAGDEASEARALSLMCEVQIARGAFDKARSAAEKAQELFDVLGDRPGEVTALLYAAQASLRHCVDEGNEDWQSLEECKLAALSSSGEAVSLCREDEEQHRDLLARSLFMLIQAELMDSRPEEALEDAQEALELFSLSGDVSSQAATLDAMARALAMLGNAQDAEKAAKEALALYVSIGEEQGEAQLVALLEQFRSGRTSRPEDAARPDDPVLALHDEKPSTLAKKSVNLGALDTSGGITLELVRNRLKAVMEELTGNDDIDGDTPLMAAGLTSATVVMFGSAIAQDFPGVPLPPTMVFDYPSLTEVSQFVFEKVK